MATQYSGIPVNITAPAATKNISSSTNATPIKITTSAAHNLTTGDFVLIAGHTTNTAANGFWPIAVVDADEFTLTGSVGVGVGGATGTVQPLPEGASYAIPADGDARNAASVNVGFEGLGDRTAFLWAYLFLSLGRLGVSPGGSTGPIYFTSNLQLVPDVVAATAYALPSPVLPAPFLGRRVSFRFTRALAANAADAVIQFSAVTIATLPGLSDMSWVDIESNAAGTGYVATAFGGDATVP